MLLDGVDVGPPKWRVCGRGLNLSIHEGMKNISNVKFQLKTCSGNVNILREKSLAIYFEDSQFRKNRTFNFIVPEIYVDKRSRVR